MILVVYYMRQRGISSVSLALIPVIVLRLPSLFNEASELVSLRLDFQIARASMGRLLDMRPTLPKLTPRWQRLLHREQRSPLPCNRRPTVTAALTARNKAA